MPGPMQGAVPTPPRCLEVLLGAGCRPCVLADTAELPSPPDIQLAHLRLRALCLPGKRGGGHGRGGRGGQGPFSLPDSLSPPPNQVQQLMRSGCRRWKGRGGWSTSGEV